MAVGVEWGPMGPIGPMGPVGTLGPVGALRDAVDALTALDITRLADVALADTFIELRAEIDRLDALAARLLVGVERRLIPCTDGATSTAAWAQWRTGQRWTEAKASLDAAKT